ncbi:MAG: hypothetical protein K9K37_10735 [Desulfocapsa sp.]|nr:hypothetical protein [Desulfocapsa sp.]
MQIFKNRNTWAFNKIVFCLLLFVAIFLSTEKVMAFEFDGFQSGLTLKQVLDLAHQRDLGVNDGQKAGIPSAHFNEKLFKETSKIIFLTYHTDLLGERVSVDLQFTPQTKRLFFVKINLKTAPKYLAGLTSVLDKKYGAHKKSFGLLFTMQKSTDWNVDERTEIKIVKNMTLYNLQYTDPSILKLPLQTNLWVISGTGKLPSV